jgi:hypothetical protein
MHTTQLAMLIIGMSAVNHPGEWKKYLPPECGQLIDTGGVAVVSKGMKVSRPTFVFWHHFSGITF